MTTSVQQFPNTGYATHSNTAVVTGSRLIPLTRGFSAIVDPEDFERLSQHKWQANLSASKVYAKRSISLPKANGKRVRKHVWMHREILGITPESPLKVDHRDGNGLNNTRGNLRACTLSQNFGNQGPRRGRRYRGVFLVSGKWQVAIQGRYIGRFPSEESAARAYDAAALTAWGDFARLNFPAQPSA